MPMDAVKAEAASHWAFLRALTWGHLAVVAGVLIGASLLVFVVREIVHRAAESAPSRHRMVILRAAPLARLAIAIAAIAIITPVLVEPNFEDVVALIATVALALAFALKDWVSCLVAGVVTTLENTYQPGDWIRMDGVYGEVRAIRARAVHIVTADDTEVVIPHARLWSTSVSNASGGRPNLLTVTDFWLRADHDGGAVSAALAEVGETCRYLKPGTAVKVTAAETPWGTHYKIKAYVAESREQFSMTTDLTLRGKERLRALGVAFAEAPCVPPPAAVAK